MSGLEFIPGASPPPPDSPVRSEPEPLPESIVSQMEDFQASMTSTSGVDEES
ncbi:hypothetical protein KKC44_04790 [Patescibacteria group bacterium]|nr:hypothetical protein [Patescibacteria group bacterium]MBU2259892.1 hypothetical protein [Patescibacteria group bacterium]